MSSATDTFDPSRFLHHLQFGVTRIPEADPGLIDFLKEQGAEQVENVAASRVPELEWLTNAGFQFFSPDTLEKTVKQKGLDRGASPFGLIFSTPLASPVTTGGRSPQIVNKMEIRHNSTGHRIIGYSGFSIYQRDENEESLASATSDGAWIQTEEPRPPVDADQFRAIHGESVIDPRARSISITDEQAAAIKARFKELSRAAIDKDFSSYSSDIRDQMLDSLTHSDGDVQYLNHSFIYRESFRRSPETDRNKLDEPDNWLSIPIFTVEIRKSQLIWYPTFWGVSTVPFRDEKTLVPYRIKGLAWYQDGVHGQIGYTPEQANADLLASPLGKAIAEVIAQ